MMICGPPSRSPIASNHIDFGSMHKVYNHLNSHPDAMGVVEILGTVYKLTRIENLRHSERPNYRGWTNPYFGTWIICPEKDVYVKVELMPK